MGRRCQDLVNPIPPKRLLRKIAAVILDAIKWAWRMDFRD
jgi:hypothetical protein